MTARQKVSAAQDAQRQGGWHPPVIRGERPAAKRYIWWIIAGAALILARVIVPAIPDIYTRAPLNQVQAMCGGPVGQLAGALNRTVQADCNSASTFMTVLNVCALGGVALVVVFGVLWLRDSGGIRIGR